LVGVLLIAWSVSLLRGNYKTAVGIRSIKVPATLFGITVVWIFFQSSGFTPEILHNPVWKGASYALGRDTGGFISVNPTATRTALMKLLAYGGIFWLSLQYSRNAENARKGLLAVSYAGLCYAVYGLVVHIGGYNTILWYEKWASFGSLTSTFVNRNHYATFAGLTLITSLAMLFNTVSGKPGQTRSHRTRIKSFVSKSIEKGWLLALSVVLILSALFLTSSRGGFAGVFAGLFALLALSIKGGGNKRWETALVASLFIFSFFSFFTLSGENTSSRIQQTVFEKEERVQIYRITLEGIADKPILGHGYGAYEEALPKYRNEKINHHYMKAHNTYLENLFELGIPVGTVFITLFAVLAVRCLGGALNRKRDAQFPAAGLAVTALVAVHSLVESSMQIPANAALYSFIMGAATAQSWHSEDHL
jgi:O-antigen ligase